MMSKKRMKEYSQWYLMTASIMVVFLGCTPKPEVKTEYIYKTIKEKVPTKCEEVDIPKFKWDTNYAITFEGMVNELLLNREAHNDKK